MRLTEEQRLKLMMASSGLTPRKFWDLGEDGQAIPSLTSRNFSR